MTADFSTAEMKPELKQTFNVLDGGGLGGRGPKTKICHPRMISSSLLKKPLKWYSLPSSPVPLPRYSMFFLI